MKVSVDGAIQIITAPETTELEDLPQCCEDSEGLNGEGPSREGVLVIEGDYKLFWCDWCAKVWVEDGEDGWHTIYNPKLRKVSFVESFVEPK